MAIKHSIKKFYSKKRNWWITAGVVVVLIIAAIVIAKVNAPNANVQTATVTKQDLKETVLATGQVVSGTDLELSFQSSGVVRGVNVKEGQKVYTGQTLAYLDGSSARAQLTQAQGSLAQAQANYEKLEAGATAANIQTYQDSVAAAQQTLQSQYSTASATLNSAYTAIFNAYSVAQNIQQTYFSQADQPGIAVMSAKSDMNTNMQQAQTAAGQVTGSAANGTIDTAVAQVLANLNNTYNDLSIIRTQTDQSQYHYTVSATDKASLDTQKANITAATSSVTSLQQGIAGDKLAVQKAQDQLQLQQSPPTQADIDVAKAQILSAQGQVSAAQATLNNTVIVAPESGTITEVDAKAGQQAVASQQAIVLQDVADLHAEADVSEANIATVQLGQPIDYTFDALSPDQHFAGKVLTVNPASTVISGVVNYLVKGTLPNISDIKPGMTANMTILVAQKSQVLSVPSTAIINKNNGYYVRVVDDPKKLTYHQVQVQEGLQADGGLVEITSGLSEGQEIVTYIK
jgi:HlyD family secretion protein